MRLPFQPEPWARAAFALVGLVVMLIVRRDLLADGEVSSWAEISAWVLFVIGFWWARYLDERFIGMVERLFHREVVATREEDPQALLSGIRRQARILGLIGSLVAVAALLILYGEIYEVRQDRGDYFGLKLTLEFIATAIAGNIGGRLVVYGSLGQWLRRRRALIRVQLGHPDGAGGLKPVGDHFLYQAGLTLLPVIFFGFWWAVGPAWPEVASQRFDFLEWRPFFAIAFLLLLIIEILAFVIPMLYFHQAMVADRGDRMGQADALGGRLVEVEHELADASDPETITRLERQRAGLQARFQCLESAPLWPVDASVRHRFTWGNGAVLALPLITKLPGVPELISSTLDNLLHLRG